MQKDRSRSTKNRGINSRDRKNNNIYLVERRENIGSYKQAKCQQEVVKYLLKTKVFSLGMVISYDSYLDIYLPTSSFFSEWMGTNLPVTGMDWSYRSMENSWEQRLTLYMERSIRRELCSWSKSFTKRSLCWKKKREQSDFSQILAPFQKAGKTQTWVIIIIIAKMRHYSSSVSHYRNYNIYVWKSRSALTNISKRNVSFFHLCFKTSSTTEQKLLWMFVLCKRMQFHPCKHTGGVVYILLSVSYNSFTNKIQLCKCFFFFFYEECIRQVCWTSRKHTCFVRNTESKRDLIYVKLTEHLASVTDLSCMPGKCCTYIVDAI